MRAAALPWAKTKAKAMTVAGVMSGTSADGVDVALCRIAEGRDGLPRVRVLGQRSFPYARAVREAVLRAMDAPAISVAELSRLDWRLGEIYADAVERTAAELELRVELVGCHGQTIFHSGLAHSGLAHSGLAHSGFAYVGAAHKSFAHQGLAKASQGEPMRATWQTGEAGVIAERMRCPVVSDFRPADMAAGGQGAPLVPMLDFCVFRSARVGRVLLNLGGIANMTALPAGVSLDEVMAFDTGPASMVIDGVMRRLYGREMDRNGAVARRGRVLERVVERVLQGAYFSALPPKSCGREEFGDRFAERLIAQCRKAGAEDADVVATATALTARSLAMAYDRFVVERVGAWRGVEMIPAGGGVRNGTLLRWIGEVCAERGVKLRSIEELGAAGEAKEAMAFALLAWLTWHGRPGNVPSATGAARAVVLGTVSFG